MILWVIIGLAVVGSVFSVVGSAKNLLVYVGIGATLIGIAEIIHVAVGR